MRRLHSAAPDLARSGSARRRDRGAVMIEFVIIAPVLVLLAMGLLEFGYGFRSHTMVSQAAADGLRVASSAGFDGLADYGALQAVAASTGSLPSDSEITRVVIFDPEATAWTNGTCRTMAIPVSGHTGVAGACNVYAGSVLPSLVPGHFVDGGSSCSITDWDRYLCPLQRDADPDGGGTMRLGLYLLVDHQMLTGLFPPGHLSMEETLEMCVEPASPSASVQQHTNRNGTL